MMSRSELIGIVRGTIALPDFRHLINRTSDDNAFYQISNESHDVICTVEPIDVAKGFLAYRYEPEMLCAWARFVLLVSDSYLNLESDFDNEQLLNALWDTSFTGKPNDSVFDLAMKIVQRT